MDSLPEVDTKTCGQCHEDMKFSDEKPFALKDNSFRIPHKIKGENLKFSHKTHQKHSMDCAACHGPLLKTEKIENTLPNMKACLQCHRKAMRTINCLFCHQTAEKPDDHATANWMHRDEHGAEAVFKKDECAMCHRTADCTECHSGATGQKIHRPDYRYTHGIDVKFKQSDCSVCHALPAFCADCHERKGAIR